jgi:acetyl-CoA synthetase
LRPADPSNRYLIRENLEKYISQALRYCTIAGEPLNPEVYNRFLEKTGISSSRAMGRPS